MSTAAPSVSGPPRVIVMNARDNVGIVTTGGGLSPGAVLSCGTVLRDAVGQGHKVALRDIAEGEAVLRYGVTIGTASVALPAGSWVHEARMRLPAAPALSSLPRGTQAARWDTANRGRAEGTDLTFAGFRNADGTVGTRNLLGIATTVQCVSGIVSHAARRIEAELLPRYPNVDGVVALEHTYGCGVAIDAPDADIPIRTLRNISRNPNFGGEVMVVGLGCEKLQPARLLPPEAFPDVEALRLQDPEMTGFDAMISQIMARAEHHLQRLGRRRRETCPASDLVVGLQCGGSDSLSGVTANPAVGVASDLLVRAGATVMFSENTEVRDAVDQLTARAATPEVAQALIAELAWYDAYLERGGADRSANTTPGNKTGGLSNIVEKAMGSIAKSGTAPIAGVVPPGERVRAQGLNFASTPASDFVCGTLQLAAGATVHVFTTGRGTPYNVAAMPVIKVATGSELARRWHDLIDIDAGPIATGAATIEEMGQGILDEILAVAGGKRTWAERHGIHNALALFNPAPLT